VEKYRSFWEESFDRLDAYLLESKSAEKTTLHKKKTKKEKTKHGRKRKS
jgi:hypothetical protein